MDSSHAKLYGGTINVQVLLPQTVMQLDARKRKGSSSSSRTSESQSSSSSLVQPEPNLRSAGGSSSESLPGSDPSSGEPAEPLAAGQGAEQPLSQAQAAAEASPAPQGESAYPSLARAKRLSYCLATALPDKFGDAEGRQVLSVCQPASWLLGLLSKYGRPLCECCAVIFV